MFLNFMNKKKYRYHNYAPTELFNQPRSGEIMVETLW
jgi:hypothetical protein